MKTRGKSKIFKCLRPATADEGYFKHSRSCDSFDFPEYSSSGSEHAGGGRGGDGASAAAGDPKILKHLSMRKPADQSSDVDGSAPLPPPPPDDPNVRKGKFRGKFRRVLKAVFFEASLVRKLRKTDSTRGPFRSRSSTNLSSSSSSQRMSRSESFSSRGHIESSDKFSRINSDSSSSRLSASSSLMTARELSSSSPCSSVPCCSPACCLERNRSISSSSRTTKQTLERGRYCWKVGWCCLILCLLALLFWGKTLAIVFISAWLYFAPLCFKSAIDPPPLFEPSHECIITTRNQPRHARRHSGF